VRAEKNHVDILDHLLHPSEVFVFMVVDFGLLPRIEMRVVEVYERGNKVVLRTSYLGAYCS
jgi:hypothetical protein